MAVDTLYGDSTVSAGAWANPTNAHSAPDSVGATSTSVGTVGIWGLANLPGTDPLGTSSVTYGVRANYPSGTDGRTMVLFVELLDGSNTVIHSFTTGGIPKDSTWRDYTATVGLSHDRATTDGYRVRVTHQVSGGGMSGTTNIGLDALWATVTYETFGPRTGSLSGTLGSLTLTAAGAGPQQKTETLVEDFSSDIDRTRWETFIPHGNGGAYPFQDEMEMVAAAFIGGSTVELRTYGTRYTLADSSFSFKLSSTNVMDMVGGDYFLVNMVSPGATTYIQLYLRVGFTQTEINGVSQSFSFDPFQHIYWRFSESGGVITIEAGPDGSSWTTIQQRSSQPTPLDLQLKFQVTGTSENVSTWAYLDDFNILPSTGFALNSTLAPATVAADGNVLVAGTAANTLGALVGASAAAVVVKGTATNALAPATVTSAGAVTIDADLTATLAAATISATGGVASTPIEGSLAATLGVMTSAAQGGVLIKGASTNTLSAATITANGSLVITASTANSLGSATATATGTVRVVGATAATLEAATLDATGYALQPQSGALDVTLDLMQGAATATNLITGAVASTLEPASVSSHVGIIATGTLATELAALSGTATAQAIVTGATARTLDGVVTAATGTVLNEGSVARTLDTLQAAAVGGTLIVATSANTLAPVTLVAAGGLLANVGVNAMLDDVLVIATARARVAGTLLNTLESVTATGLIETLIHGAASIQLGALTSVATIGVISPASGTVNKTLDALTVAVTVVVVSPIEATLSATLAPATVFATVGTVSPVMGALEASLASCNAQASGTVRVTGALQTNLLDAVTDATGNVRTTGTFAGTLADATSTGTLALVITGALSATLGSATVASDAALICKGDLTAALSSLVGDLNGRVVITGAASATLDNAVATAAGRETLDTGGFFPFLGLL